jgi:hypothetical protein
MLIVYPGSQVEIPFVYKSGFSFVDPTEDIYVFLRRGQGSAGAVILGPLKYDISLIGVSTPGTEQQLSQDATIERLSQGSYILRMSIPQNLFEGFYAIQISTTADALVDLKEHFIQCLRPVEQNNEVFSPEDKNIVINNRSKYEPVNVNDTNSILLIGHTDGIEPFSIYRITSIQDGINKLRADFNSPLLRGLIETYSSGARDIYIMSAGYMSEYVNDVELRNIKTFADDGATPNEYNNAYSFYEYYFFKLELCYQILRDYEFIDIIVPLETSIVDTNGVNFVSQLASHCDYIQNITGEVQIGIIGSRSISTVEENVNELKNKDFEIPTVVNSEGVIQQDSGKYILLIYGEVIFDHKQMQRTYVGSLAAAMAGTLASTRVDYGLTKKRLPSAFAIYGPALTSQQIKFLAENKINTISNGTRSRRNEIYDVYITSDYTQSISENYSDSSNVRLVAMIINEVQNISRNAIGKFSYDRATRNVDALLNILKSARIIQNYTLDAYADKLEKGKLYFTISVVSVRTLRKISFNVATGKGV